MANFIEVNLMVKVPQTASVKAKREGISVSDLVIRETYKACKTISGSIEVKHLLTKIRVKPEPEIEKKKAPQKTGSPSKQKKKSYSDK